MPSRRASVQRMRSICQHSQCTQHVVRSIAFARWSLHDTMTPANSGQFQHPQNTTGILHCIWREGVWVSVSSFLFIAYRNCRRDANNATWYIVAATLCPWQLFAHCYFSVLADRHEPRQHTHHLPFVPFHLVAFIQFLPVSWIPIADIVFCAHGKWYRNDNDFFEFNGSSWLGPFGRTVIKFYSFFLCFFALTSIQHSTILKYFLPLHATYRHHIIHTQKRSWSAKMLRRYLFSHARVPSPAN